MARDEVCIYYLYFFCKLLVRFKNGSRLIFGAQAPDCFTGPPHFALTEFAKFHFKFFTVISLAVAVDTALGFLTRSDAFIEFPENRSRSITEFFPPIQRSPLCSRGTIGIHPVHSVLSNQWHQALGEFFHGFVEGF